VRQQKRRKINREIKMTNGILKVALAERQIPLALKHFLERPRFLTEKSARRRRNKSKDQQHNSPDDDQNHSLEESFIIPLLRMDMSGFPSHTYSFLIASML
jgi:hypothetical protein